MPYVNAKNPPVPVSELSVRRYRDGQCENRASSPTIDGSVGSDTAALWLSNETGDELEASEPTAH